MKNNINKRAWEVRRRMAVMQGVGVMEIRWKVCYGIAREEWKDDQSRVKEGWDKALGGVAEAVMVYNVVLYAVIAWCCVG